MRNVTIQTQSTSELTTKTKVKNYLDIDNTDHDTLIERLVDSATTFIQNYTGYEWLETEYKEVIDGIGNNSLTLSQKPIISVSDFSIDGDSLDSSDYIVYNKPAIIKRDDNVFPEGDLNITVEYTAGYSTLPADIEQACIELAGFIFENRDYLGLESHDLGDESVQFNKKDIPQEIRQTLDQHSKVRW